MWSLSRGAPAISHYMLMLSEVLKDIRPFMLIIFTFIISSVFAILHLHRHRAGQVEQINPHEVAWGWGRQLKGDAAADQQDEAMQMALAYDWDTVSGSLFNAFCILLGDFNRTSFTESSLTFMLFVYLSIGTSSLYPVSSPSTCSSRS